MQILNTPVKWTSDWFPQEFKIRKYIFDTRRKVCVSYWYEEYLWPLVENSDIWKAKSWEDVGWAELTRITDKDWNITEVAIRPEMTPSVTRMVSRVWKEYEKPIKWFSIANFYRNEKPQKWRNREFWQLNVDLFWENNIYADIEILSLTLDIMKAFNPPENSFKLKINHREVINIFFSEVLWIRKDEDKKKLMRILDKYAKLSKESFEKSILEIWQIDISLIENFMKSSNISDLEKYFPSLKENQNFINFKNVFNILEKNFWSDVIEFSASIIRWFDYYDGIIFEMFDTNKDNSRSLFGGWRYNWLASIFWVKDEISAIWFAPWDETMKLFLENWGLIDDIIWKKEENIYLPLLDEKYFEDIQNIASLLRSSWKNVLVWLSVKKLSKALNFADKKWFSEIIIFGETEKSWNFYISKKLNSWEETKVNL